MRLKFSRTGQHAANVEIAMATNATRSQQVAGNSAAHAATANAPDARRAGASASSTAPTSSGKSSGYGLPCAKCHQYYPVDLDTCPTCHHNQRVSAVAAKLPPPTTEAATNPSANVAALEQEREEFLRQFKSQLLDAHSEAANATKSVCQGEKHSGGTARAEVCKACYEHLQERLDACEGALRMDLTEAAQIVYDAVWADPSNPGRTYQNAANALLAELRKRAGVSSKREPMQGLSD